jgi:predicted thioesterase
MGGDCSSGIQADDDHERVGERTHERFIADMQRFMDRIATKGC